MLEESSIFRFFGRHKKSVFTFLLFIAYAGAVFWSNYQSLQKVQENALVQFQLETEKQASAISYFFSERQIEAAELAESEAVVNFFRNRDLGMSYQYGLGVNVQLIEDRFEYVARKKRGSDRPVFSGFMLIDSEGSPVATWNAPEPMVDLKDWLLPESRDSHTHLGTRQGDIVAMAPVWINNVYRGEILAWIDAETSFAQFGPARSARHSVLVNHKTGEPIHRETGSPALPDAYWNGLQNQSVPGKSVRTISYEHHGKNYAIAGVDIEGTPITFVSISSAEVTEKGTERLFLIAAAIIPFIVILVGFLDMLERRRLENLRLIAQTEAERLAQARSDFLANMSHEIRTPMNAIIGMTELCLATQPSEKQRNYLSKIQQTSDLLLRIINDILDFSKIESGKLELDQSPFDLDRVLGDVGNLLSGKAERKSIEIAFDVDDSCNRIFVGDSLRLEQVLINLIGNAIKFSERGNIIVRVRCEETGTQAARLHFTVSDEGIGISEEQQARLFKAFVQADATTTRRYGGTGLGLAISKRLVELMGGRIGVKSTLGEGSTFSFFIALGFDPGQKSNFIAVQKKLQLFAQRPVLIIDDNPVYRQALAAQLHQIGLSSETLASAEEGVAAVTRSNHPDYLAILVDLHMPECNGIETIRSLRKAWTRGSIPPVFLVTTCALDMDLETDAFMFDGILTKPTTANRLFTEIAPFLGIRVEEEFSSRSSHFDPRDLHGLDVLLVDDVQFNQEVVRDMLEDAGMRVRVANNGSEALDAIATKAPDCVLMDCQMPVMDGYEATRRIREKPQYRNLPVIALTANALVSEREKCRAAGMDDYLVKPVKSADLLPILAKHTPSREGYLEAHTVPPPSIRPPEKTHPDFPEIAGIDYASGLRYANGRVANYLKILHLFNETHGRNFTTGFRVALEEENWGEATRLAHSLKSAARTIGAEQLGQLGKELEETCLAQNKEIARQTLNSLALEMESICSGLADLPQAP